MLVAGLLAKDFKSNLGSMLAGAVLHFIIITVMTKVQRPLNVYFIVIVAVFSVILIS